MEPENNLQKIIFEAPMVEMIKYATDLRSITQARGSFVMEMDRYEEVPEVEANKIIENAKKLKEIS